MERRLCRFIASVCISASSTEPPYISLTQELQELISLLENTIFHFQAQQDFLLEGDGLVLPESYTCEIVQNGRQGRQMYKITSFKLRVSEIWVSHGEKLQVSFVFRSKH